jgi:hypothetical protein
MNPYDAPASQPRSNTRRVWFLLTITLLVSIGITTVLVLGIWARKEARRDRSSGNFRRMGQAIQAYESSLKRTEQSSNEEIPQEVK